MVNLHRPPILTSSHSPSIKKVSQVPSLRRLISAQQPTLRIGLSPQMTDADEQNLEFLQRDLQEICHQCKASYVHHWITRIHRENSKTGQDTHETLSMASQDSLEIQNVPEFSHSLDSENETTQGMVVKPTKRPVRRIPTPQTDT